MHPIDRVARAGRCGLTIVAAALPAALAACGSGGEARSASAGGDPDERVPAVAVIEVEPRDLVTAVSLGGPVEPLRTVAVNSRTSGTIVRLDVEEGDRVVSGQLLARLDAREPSAQLGRARAVMENAEAAYARQRQLHERGLATDAELEGARSAFEVARADVELWETRLGFTRIDAPLAGIVTTKHVEPGHAVAPNQPLFEIADTSMQVVRVRISELHVVALEPGDSVAVRVDAYPAVEIPGRIRRIFPSADPRSRLVPVEVTLGAMPPGVVVRPGFLARVTFALDRRSAVLAVPVSAVGTGTDGPFAYVVDADTLVRRGLRTGLTAQGWIEVGSGLERGERVVVSGSTELRPGMRVRVTRVGIEGEDGAAGEVNGER